MNRRFFLRGSAAVGAAIVSVKALPKGEELSTAELIAEVPEPDYTMATMMDVSSMNHTQNDLGDLIHQISEENPPFGGWVCPKDKYKWLAT